MPRHASRPPRPSRPPLPTDAELEILRVLWARGPSTVRDVHAALGSDTSYTTTLKLLQNMHDKGIVRRDDSRRQHVYEARADEASTLGSLVSRVVDRMFNGSAAALALHALGGRSATREELAELKRLIRAMERREGEGGG